MATKYVPPTKEAFRKMGKEDRAVAIAKDVLQILRYVNATHTYFDIHEASAGLVKTGKAKRDHDDDYYYYEAPCRIAAKDAQAALLDKNVLKKRYVCGIGAQFVSFLRINDSVPIESAWNTRGEASSISAAVDDSLIHEKLDHLLPVDMLHHVELAYETWTDLGKAWGDAYKNDRERLVAIMKRIIKNKGTFTAQDLP